MGSIRAERHDSASDRLIQMWYDRYMEELIPFAQHVLKALDDGEAQVSYVPSKPNVLAFGCISHRAEWLAGARYPGNLRTKSATTNFWRCDVRGADGQLRKSEPKVVSYNELKCKGEEVKALHDKNLCFTMRDGVLINGDFRFDSGAR